MSNPQKPDDDMADVLMGRAEEMAHVQSRFANLGGPDEPPGEAVGEAPGEPGPKPSPSVTEAPVPPAQREGIGTPPPSREDGARRVAAAFRFGAAGFAFMSVVLFVLPELRGSFQAPAPAELNQPAYNTIAPVLGTLEPPEALQVFTEQTAPFQGASVLVVESKPEGAMVWVDGRDVGGSPVSLTLDCVPGKPIKVEVARKGFERAQHLTFCRNSTMIKLYARLLRAGKQPGPSGSPE